MLIGTLRNYARSQCAALEADGAGVAVVCSCARASARSDGGTNRASKIVCWLGVNRAWIRMYALKKIA